MTAPKLTAVRPAALYAGEALGEAPPAEAEAPPLPPLAPPPWTGEAPPLGEGELPAGDWPLGAALGAGLLEAPALEMGRRVTEFLGGWGTLLAGAVGAG